MEMATPTLTRRSVRILSVLNQKKEKEDSIRKRRSCDSFLSSSSSEGKSSNEGEGEVERVSPGVIKTPKSNDFLKMLVTVSNAYIHFLYFPFSSR